MPERSQTDTLLVDRIRAGEQDAWSELIARYEGRLLAFVGSRANSRAAAEDVVQETFIGFLTSLPNYDARRSLESYLFSIAAHKLTDHLRREGRRPTVPLCAEFEPQRHVGPARHRPARQQHPPQRRAAPARGDRAGRGHARADRPLAPSRRLAEARSASSSCWSAAGPTRKSPPELGITEQAVANHKFQFLAGLRDIGEKQELPEDVFPELYEE